MNTNGTAIIKKSNPAPIGLLGFGITTVLLNIHNTGAFPLDTMLVALGIFIGGGVQLIAGILMNQRNDTFATVAFCLYGTFWMSLSAIWLLPVVNNIPPPSNIAMAYYFGIFAVVSFGLFIATFKLNRVLIFILANVVILLTLLAIQSITAAPWLLICAGVIGILCGSGAIYLAFAQIINEVFNRDLLPVGDCSK